MMNEQNQQEYTHLSSSLRRLPALAELIGREEEVQAGVCLLAAPGVRLLTLTGVGGVGKTRLALALAEQAGHLFVDGVSAVSLATLTQPDLLLPALLQGLGIREEQEQSPWETLVAFLRPKRTLLLLDNFEQVVEAATLLGDLLARCPHLKVLVTSREILRVRGEYLFQVHPLPLPELTAPLDEEALAGNAAVRLFTQRLREIRPALAVSGEHLHAIGEICVRLDGLPLAIELAVARCHLFSPRTLLEHLENRLALLTHGPRDLPPRQQTLRKTLAWSYALLSGREQRLFRVLAICAGGCTPAAAQALLGEAGDVLDLLTTLLEKNLLQRVGTWAGEPRLRMLETLREYGLECLRDSGEYEEVRERHAGYYLRLAEQAGPELERPGAFGWPAHLEQELDNLREALQWWNERGEDECALRLVVALRFFWIVTGHGREGYQWIMRALARNSRCQPALRARAYLTAGMLAPYHACYQQWQTLCQESLQLFQELDDKRGMAEALNELGCAACWQGRLSEAYQLHTRGLALWQICANQQGIASTKLHLARVLHAQSRYQAARELAEESLQLFRALEQRRGVAQALSLLAFLASYYQERKRSLWLAEESLRLFQALGEQWEIAAQLHAVAELALHQNNHARTLECIEESLEVARRAGNREALARGLYILAQVHWKMPNSLAGTAFLAESQALYEELGNQEGVAAVLLLRSQYAYLLKDYPEARALLERCLQILVHKENKPALIGGLAELARLVALEGRANWSIRLLAVSDALREAIGRPPFPLKDAYRRITSLFAIPPGEREFSAAWRAGRAMTPAQVVAAHEEALSAAPVSVPARSGEARAQPPAARLTAREREVLRLLTQGLTNPQIATRLVISPVTVNAHVRSIYDKLAVTSRSAATRYALLHQLV